MPCFLFLNTSDTYEVITSSADEKWFIWQGIIKTFFLGGCTTKKCNPACDQAFIRVCIEYTYISELMLWLHRDKFVNVE